jgi:CheY-like chemotaxis protein
MACGGGWFHGTVTCDGNGNVAWRASTRTGIPPPAVIADIQLPGISGIELVAKLRLMCSNTQFLISSET